MSSDHFSFYHVRVTLSNPKQNGGTRVPRLAGYIMIPIIIPKFESCLFFGVTKFYVLYSCPITGTVTGIVPVIDFPPRMN